MFISIYTYLSKLNLVILNYEKFQIETYLPKYIITYEELLTIIGKEFNIDKYDEKKIKYLILVDGEGELYKIKKKSHFKGFKVTIEDQQNTETEGIFNYDGDNQIKEVQHSDEHNQPSKGEIHILIINETNNNVSSINHKGIHQTIPIIKC